MWEQGTYRRMKFISDENGTLTDDAYRYEEDEKASFPLRPGMTAAKNVRLAVPRSVGKPVHDSRSSLEKAHSVLLAGRDVPFTFEPKVVNFADARLGRPQSVTVRFTNRSLRSTSFRVLAIAPLYADVLTVEYSVPPRISPGLSWSVVVRFTPRTREDISTELSIRTEEGSFYIPITTSRERPDIRVSPTSLDFGSVPIGRTVVRVITVANNGAKEGVVRLTGSVMRLLLDTRTDPRTGTATPFMCIQPTSDRLTVAPHTSFPITLTFQALEATELDHTLLISVGPNKGSATTSTTVAIRGCATAAPVALASSTVDFGECFYGVAYTASATVVNTSNVSVLVTPQVPPALAEHIRFEPRDLRVQAHGEFTCAVIFSPSLPMESYFRQALRFVVPGQVIAPVLHLHAQLSRRRLEVDTTSVLFDEAHVREEVVRALHITNPSRVCQRVRFVDLPTNAVVVPSTLTLLPSERAEFRLCVVPLATGPTSFTCGVMNGYDDRVDVSVVVRAVLTHVTFSEATVWLPRCALGSNVSAHVLMTSNSSDVCRFTFSVPHSSLAVAPSSGYIEPFSTVPVSVFFAPPAAVATDAACAMPTAGAVPSSETEEDAERTDKKAKDPSSRRLRAKAPAAKRPLPPAQDEEGSWGAANCDGVGVRRGVVGSEHAGDGEAARRVHAVTAEVVSKDKGAEDVSSKCDVHNIRCVCESLDVRGRDCGGALETRVPQGTTTSTLVVQCTTVQPTLLGRCMLTSREAAKARAEDGGAARSAAEASTGRGEKNQKSVSARGATAVGGAGQSSFTSVLPSRRRGKDVLAKNVASAEGATVPTEQPLLVPELSPIVHIDFGEVAFRSEAMRVACIRNNKPDSDVEIRIRPLNPLSPFQLLRYPPSTLRPGEEGTLLVQFKPTSVGTFMSECIVGGSDCCRDINDVCFVLRGNCFCSSLQILRAGDDYAERSMSIGSNNSGDSGNADGTIGVSKHTTTTILDVAAVQLGRNVKEVVYLYNAGERTISAQAFVGHATDLSSDWMSRGTVITYPDRFVVPPRERVPCTIVFTPPLVGLYSACIRVEAGELFLNVHVRGRCHADAVYLTLSKLSEITPPMPCTAPYLHFNYIQQYQPGDSIALSCAVGESKKIIVGSVKDGPTVEGAIVQLDQGLIPVNWTIEPTTFALASGKEMSISVSRTARTTSIDEETRPNVSTGTGTTVASPCLRFSVILRCTLESSEELRYYVTCT